MTRTSAATSTVPFGPIDVEYDEHVLTPRPWTLAQSQWACDLLTELPPGQVLELCSGAGQIGQVVAARTGRGLVQIDACFRACEMARRNAVAAGVVADVRCRDLRAGLHTEERFVLVIADPPYIPTADVGQFPDDPGHAIEGGSDGLDVARRCVAVAAAHLQRGGLLLVQLWHTEQARELGIEIDASSRLRTVARRSIGEHGALLLARADD